MTMWIFLSFLVDPSLFYFLSLVWPLLKMDNILGSVDENNTGDGQTLSCVPQESPSEILGPTIDVLMRSGKKKVH